MKKKPIFLKKGNVYAPRFGKKRYEYKTNYIPSLVLVAISLLYLTVLILISK
jgi:hypothetical protein